MRISDWSSDVCSSDLKTLRHGHVIDAVSVGIRSVDIVERQLHAVVHVEPALRLADQAQIGIVDHDMQVRQLEQIGRASCRERVSVRVDLGGRRILKKTKQPHQTQQQQLQNNKTQKHI